ncbi:MAG: hypothetical protein ACR2LT_09220 [Pyrinomonadaceae bacterium]
MRFYQKILILLSAFLIFSCAAKRQPQTPFETFKAYTQAIKNKNSAAMKELLSKESLKMAQDEAKAQNAPLDEIIQRETLFNEDQRAVEFRNEKIEGDKATIEVKDSTGLWNSVPFVKEDGMWKIAKESYADELMKQADEDNKRLDEQINKSRQP